MQHSSVEMEVLMNILKNWNKKKKILVIVITAVVVVILGILSWIIYLNSYKPSQNIYFLEYENEYEKNDTIIFKYDPTSNKVEEIGRVPGYLYKCVINNEESRITGFLKEDRVKSKSDIIVYDIETGTAESKEIMDKIFELTMDIPWYGVLYDGGDKIVVNYADDKENEWVLFYDFATGEDERVVADINEIYQFLAVNDHSLWYYKYFGAIYHYDWKTQTKTKILDSVNSATMAPNNGLIAYTEGLYQEKIYLYDISQGKNKTIASGGWNIYYGDLSISSTNAWWSNDSRQLCYISYFPGLFQEADTRLMVYDIESGRRRCIYKVNATLHELSYISCR